MPKLRWLWTAISLAYTVVLSLLLLQDRQVSTLLLSQQPAIGQPVVDQLASLSRLFVLFFVCSVVLTFVAWGLWASEKSKLRKINVI